MKNLLLAATCMMTSCSPATALDLKLKAGVAVDSGKNTPENYLEGHKTIGDVGLYLSYEPNPFVELSCGLYHASNPEEADGKTLAVNGFRCETSVTIWRTR